MDDIRHTMRTKATESDILQALTTETGLKGWWASRVTRNGDLVQMNFTKDGNEVKMTFDVDSDTDPVLWTCTNNDNPVWIGTKLKWEITDSGDTRLIYFSHADFTQGGPPYQATVEIWEHFVASLEHYLESGRGEPWP